MDPKKGGIKNNLRKEVKPEELKIIRKSSRIEQRNNLIEKGQTTEIDRQYSIMKSSVLRENAKSNVRKSTVLGGTKTPSPNKADRIRMSLPKDFFSREELEKTPRSDGLDQEILDYYLNEAYKSSPNYLDLKAKRWNSSFRHETPRRRDIVIFTPEEEAEFAEERLKIYGPVPDESVAEAKSKKFAEALTDFENLPCKKKIDEKRREYYKKLEREIAEEKKKNGAKSSKKGKKNKKQQAEPCDNILLNYDDLFEPGELSSFLGIEKEADLLARWKTECEAKKQKKCAEDKIVAGTSFLSSYDPASKEDSIISTPNPLMKKSSMRKMVQDEKNVLLKSTRKNWKKGKNKLVNIVSQSRKKNIERYPSSRNKKK